MRISARNQIKGTWSKLQKGATTSHVRVDIGGGQIVTLLDTNEAVDELGIKAKGTWSPSWSKASDVMIGGGLDHARALALRAWYCSERLPHGRRKNRAAVTNSNGRSSASGLR